MNGRDDLPERVRDALAHTEDDPAERARRLEVICGEAAQSGHHRVAAWATIERSRVAWEMAEYDAASAWCDRALRASAPAEARAVAVVLRAHLDGTLPGRTVAPADERSEIERAADVLVASGMWEDAAAAHAYLAHAAGTRDDLAGARREYARAIGCAEAGCARHTGPGFLIALARAETRLGDPRNAVGYLDQALARLEPVMLLFARHREAACYDALGDAWAALGSAVHAADAWREAAARYERLERAKPAAAVRDKIAGLGR